MLEVDVSPVYLLDTNIFVAYLNEEEAVVSRVESERVFGCSIVLGELFFGAFKSSQAEKNGLAVEAIADSFAILTCDEETARFYGGIKQELRQKGRPIPENDIWIAAIACQYEIVLVTRDAHFREIEDLKVEIW